MKEEVQGSMLKNVFLHTLAFTVAAVLSTIMASKVALAVVNVRLEHNERNIIELEEAFVTLVEIQKNDAVAIAWMSSTDKTISTIATTQNALVEATKDRYTRSEAKEDLLRIHQRIDKVQDQINR